MTDYDVLKGKTALITGASSGLGADFARVLASYGSHLILVARTESAMNLLKNEIQAAHNININIISLDLTAPSACDNLYKQIQALGLQVDILINNAGFGAFGKFIDIPLERELNMLDLDIKVPVHLTKLFLPSMIARRKGFILFISSTGGYQPVPTYAGYGAAKSFILNFGEALNYEIKNTGVSCTVLSPGITKTQFLAVSGQKPSLYQRLLVMQSEDVVRLGIKGMINRRPSLIPGWINKFNAFSIRFLPRRAATTIAYYFMNV